MVPPSRHGVFRQFPPDLSLNIHSTVEVAAGSIDNKNECQAQTRGRNMLKLGSKVRYEGHNCIVVGRTFEAHPRYDLLFPVSRRIERNVLERDLKSCSTDYLLQLTGGFPQVERQITSREL
jgi:hypothetical protein